MSASHISLISIGSDSYFNGKITIKYLDGTTKSFIETEKDYQKWFDLAYEYLYEHKL